MLSEDSLQAARTIYVHCTDESVTEVAITVSLSHAVVHEVPAQLARSNYSAGFLRNVIPNYIHVYTVVLRLSYCSFLPIVYPRTLRQELEKERYFQKQLLGKSQCTCCERRLVVIFNPGAPCPGCLYQVCKQCRVLSHKPPPPFLCPVCVKKRLVG